MRPATALTLVALCGFLGACFTTRNLIPKDTEEPKVDWGATDVRNLARRLADSLLASPQLSYLQHPGKGDDLRIVAYVAGVSGAAGTGTAALDASRFLQQFETTLKESLRFRFVVPGAGPETGARPQPGPGRVDLDQARSLGRQAGADVVLHGSLSPLPPGKDPAADRSAGPRAGPLHRFAIGCWKVGSGEPIWLEEMELDAGQRAALFGQG